MAETEETTTTETTDTDTGAEDTSTETTETEETTTEDAGDTGSDTDDTAGDSGAADDDIDLSDFEPEERKPKTQAGDTGTADDDELDPADRTLINRELDKRVSPLEKKIAEQETMIEVNQYVMDNPELAKYKPAILKYANHPAYANVPIKNIAAIVSAKDAQKIGAAKERAAAAKAKSTKNGSGTSARSSAKTTQKDWGSASFGDVEAEIARVKGQV